LFAWVAAVRRVGQPRMSSIARDLARDLPIRFSERVESLRRMPGEWSVVTEGGDEATGFDCVLLAVPAPQAVPLLRESPALARRANQVRMRPCHALMLRFESELDVDFDAAFVRSSALGWIARNASKPERDAAPTWVLHSTPDWSDEHLESAAEAIHASLLGDFEEALGETLPPIRFSAMHRWLYAHPLVDGSDDEPLRDRETGLGACGDWVRGDRVEDAYLSGEALADVIEAR